MLSGSITNISSEWQSYLLLFSVGLSLIEAKVKITVARCFVSLEKKNRYGTRAFATKEVL